MNGFFRSIVVALVMASMTMPTVVSGAEPQVGTDQSKRVAAEKAVAAVEANDSIPGVLAPASPIIDALDALDEFGDMEDVYKFYLTAGSKLTLNMTGPADPADFDLYLFGPSATDAWMDDYVASSENLGCTEAITYTALTSGYHYLDVCAWGGAGAYSITYSIEAPPAIAVTDARFLNPIAYKLKSFLTTQFTCTVNTPGTTAKLDVLGGTGAVVKTVYNGALASGTNKLPAWNGLDAYGRRLPSSSYKWRLVVSKPGSAPVTTYGNITISKIYFCLPMGAGPGGVSFERYMVPGNANLYIALSTAPPGDTLSLTVTEPSAAKIAQFTWSVPPSVITHRTAYLRSTSSVRQFGMHAFTFRTGKQMVAYNLIVIQ